METTTLTGRICFTEQRFTDFVRTPQDDRLDLRTVAARTQFGTRKLELAELIVLEYPEDGLCEPAD